MQWPWGHRRKACKAYQNKILFSSMAHLSSASVLPTRCTTDTSIATVLYNLRLAEYVKGDIDDHSRQRSCL